MFKFCLFYASLSFRVMFCYNLHVKSVAGYTITFYVRLNLRSILNLKHSFLSTNLGFNFFEFRILKICEKDKNKMCCFKCTSILIYIMGCACMFVYLSELSIGK